MSAELLHRAAQIAHVPHGIPHAAQVVRGVVKAPASGLSPCAAEDMAACSHLGTAPLLHLHSTSRAMQAPQRGSCQRRDSDQQCVSGRREEPAYAVTLDLAEPTALARERLAGSTTFTVSTRLGLAVFGLLGPVWLVVARHGGVALLTRLVHGRVWSDIGWRGRLPRLSPRGRLGHGVGKVSTAAQCASKRGRRVDGKSLCPRGCTRGAVRLAVTAGQAVLVRVAHYERAVSLGWALRASCESSGARQRVRRKCPVATVSR